MTTSLGMTTIWYYCENQFLSEQKSVSLRKHLQVIVVCLIACEVTTATEYVVDVPQLVGLHGTAPYTVVDVEAQLPTAFSKIDSGTLRLSGEQFPGTAVNFITGAQGPIGASLQLEDSSSNDPFLPFPYFVYRLSGDLHEFSLEIPIGVAYQAIPDFKQWLDGTAEFTFSVGPPPTTGGYAVYPLVQIDHAELILMGQPLGVPEPASAYSVIATVAFLIGLFRCRRLPLWIRPGATAGLPSSAGLLPPACS